MQQNNEKCMSKTLVIAEIGVNHNGNFKTAKELVAQTSKCGQT